MVVSSERLNTRLHKLARTSGVRAGWNIARFGREAPRPGERLLIDPCILTRRYAPHANGMRFFGARYAGHVEAGDWDLAQNDLANTLKYKACVAHFLEGRPWEDTGIYNHLLKRIATSGPIDNCRTRADVMKRYADLDALWEITLRTKSMPLSATLKRRTRDSILVLVDRNGTLLFGNQGFHRLAIAQLAGVAEIPVAIGGVHADAVTSGAYAQLLSDHGLLRVR